MLTSSDFISFTIISENITWCSTDSRVETSVEKKAHCSVFLRTVKKE